jgi:hypothetical protein
MHKSEDQRTEQESYQSTGNQRSLPVFLPGSFVGKPPDAGLIPLGPENGIGKAGDGGITAEERER